MNNSGIRRGPSSFTTSITSLDENPFRAGAWEAKQQQIHFCSSEQFGHSRLQLNVGILEAYTKSWTSGSLDRAAARGSIGFRLALHHLSCFVFGDSDKSALRNKLVKSLLRIYSQKQHHQGMMLDLVQYKLPILQGEAERRRLTREEDAKY